MLSVSPRSRANIVRFTSLCASCLSTLGCESIQQGSPEYWFLIILGAIAAVVLVGAIIVLTL